MLATGVPIVVGVRKRLLFSPAVSNVPGSGGTLTPLQKTKRSLHNRFAKALLTVLKSVVYRVVLVVFSLHYIVTL